MKKTRDTKKQLELKRRTLRLLGEPSLEYVQGGMSAACHSDCCPTQSHEC